MRSLVLAMTTLTAALATAPAAADRWAFDRQNTEVRFSWDHLGLSRQSGRFLEMRGQLDFTPTDPEAGAIDVTIRASSLWTGVRELDEILKSPDYFDTARFPEIRFKSTAVQRVDDNTGELLGELTLLGVTRPVTLRVRWNYTGEYPLAAINPIYQNKWVSGFSAETRILRSDWGLKRALPLISDEIRISIEAEFLRQD
ncbi:MAG: YceI family protein [Hyphomicrobiaceae bacterium]